MTMPETRPAPIRTDHTNAFANNTMRVRLPEIIDETIALNADYQNSIKRRLGELRDELKGGALIRALDSESAADYEAWTAAIAAQRDLVDGELTWHNAEWFFAETYAYRCLVEAVRWGETGRDPFLPKKRAELKGEAIWRLLDRALQPIDSAEDELRRAVEFDLWGNRIDLSYAASMARGTEISEDDLLVDDRDALLAYLAESAETNSPFMSARTVYIVADNAGSELAMDLVFADCLLRHVSDRVVLCLKAHPTFVSDAITADVWMMLDEMARPRVASSGAGRAAARCMV